jgi:hypothetical protein
MQSLSNAQAEQCQGRLTAVRCSSFMVRQRLDRMSKRRTHPAKVLEAIFLHDSQDDPVLLHAKLTQVTVPQARLQQ